jgi:hypothetical protein
MERFMTYSVYYRFDQIEKIGPAETFCEELLVCALNGNLLAKKYFLNYLYGKIDGCIAESFHKAKEIYDLHNKERSNGVSP